MQAIRPLDAPQPIEPLACCRYARCIVRGATILCTTVKKKRGKKKISDLRGSTDCFSAQTTCNSKYSSTSTTVAQRTVPYRWKRTGKGGKKKVGNGGRLDGAVALGGATVGGRTR